MVEGDQRNHAVREPAAVQMTAGGPDIPDPIRLALEEERLVLFCGAGVSMRPSPTSAGRPSYRGLVDGVYERLGSTREGPEASAYSAGLLDRTLHLLEARMGRDAVRSAIVAQLEVTAPTDRHTSVVELAKLRESQ